MIHCTLSTGHIRESPRHEVSDDTLDTIRPWLAPGRHALPVPGGYSLVVPVCERGLIATVMQATTPVAMIGVAADEVEADAVWPALVRVQQAVCEVAAVRPLAPWCAAALLVTSPATMEWLGDFERCLAWAHVSGRVSDRRAESPIG